MLRENERPESETIELTPFRYQCASCGEEMQFDYSNHRTVVRARGLLRLGIKVLRCHTRKCPLWHMPYHPEGEPNLK